MARDEGDRGRNTAGSRITIADVARTAGVSPSAVSFALNGRPGIADDTRERILRIADELGWRPSTRARALARARADAIGLIIARPPELLGGDPFFGAFLAGIESVLSPLDQALLLKVISGGVDEELDAYRQLARSDRVDGVILSDLRHRDPRLPLLDELGIRTVIAGDPAGGGPFPAVGPDDHVGTNAAVAHLVRLGHRRIAYVAGPGTYEHARRRRAGWADALRSADLEPALSEEGDFTSQSGAAATERLLEGATPPTAIVYGNDLMAMGGITIIRTRGLRVPRDISVIGYDDVPQARLTVPALTTVRQDVVAHGRAAAARLLTEVTGEAVEADPVPAPHLIVRASTAELP